MSLFLQIMISTWIISTICVIIGYTSALSNRDFAGLIKTINKSETLNLFGKILSNLLYVFLCPIIAIPEWLIIAKKKNKK